MGQIKRISTTDENPAAHRAPGDLRFFFSELPESRRPP
jgi:hypothetical protein